MKKLILAILSIVSLLCSCNSPYHEYSKADTVNILSTAISSKEFAHNFDQLNYKPSTLYFITDNKYSIYLPGKIKPFHIQLIQDTKLNREPVISTKSDLRDRLGIAKLNLKNDSANLILVSFNSNREDHFILIKKAKVWRIHKTFYGVN